MEYTEFTVLKEKWQDDAARLNVVDSSPEARAAVHLLERATEQGFNIIKNAGTPEDAFNVLVVLVISGFCEGFTQGRIVLPPNGQKPS